MIFVKSKLREYLINQMGDFLFDSLDEAFRKILESEYNVLCFMAYHAYSIYKTFEPLYANISEYKKATENKIIVNDIDIFSHSLAENDKILIIDDTIFSAKSMHKFIKKLTENYKIPETNIGIYVTAAGDKFISTDLPPDNAASEPWRVHLHKGVFYFPQKSKNKYFIIKDFGYIRLVKLSLMRRYSRDYITAIHMTGTPYNAYAPSFEIKWQYLDRLLNARTFKAVTEILNGGISEYSPLLRLITEDNLHDNLRGYRFHDITQSRMKEYGTVAFTLSSEKSCGSTVFFSCQRVYINFMMRKITIIPYVAIPMLNHVGAAYDKLLKSAGLSELARNRSNADIAVESRNALQYRFLIYAYDYMKTEEFLSVALNLKKSRKDYCENNRVRLGRKNSKTIFDSAVMKKISQNAEKFVFDDIIKAGSPIEIVDEFRGDGNFEESKAGKLLIKCINAVKNSDINVKVEQVLERYFAVLMLENDLMANIYSELTIPLNLLVNKLVELFYDLRSIKIEQHSIQNAVIKICDKGVADVRLPYIEIGKQSAIWYNNNDISPIINYSIRRMYDRIGRQRWKTKVNSEAVYKLMEKGVQKLTDSFNKDDLLFKLKDILICTTPESFAFDDDGYDDTAKNIDHFFLGFANSFARYAEYCDKNSKETYDVSDFVNIYIHEQNAESNPHIKIMQEFFRK